MTDKKTRATPDTSGGLENLLGDLTGEILSTVIAVATEEKPKAEKLKIHSPQP